MNISILTLVMTVSVVTGQNSTPTWLNDYGQAQRLGINQQKPLAVVFGSGSSGWNQLISNAPLTADVQRLLSDKYVCVYVNTNTVAGKELAKVFDINEGVGLVISDRTGANQMFWHQGVLTNANLAHYLGKHADSRVSNAPTETVNTVRTSFYPQGTPATFNSGFMNSPGFSGGGFSGGGSRGGC